MLLTTNQNTGNVVSFDINDAPMTKGKVVANVSLAYPDQDGDGPRGSFPASSWLSFVIACSS